MESKKLDGFLDVLKEFAESSTWHGIPKIASSRQLAVKILWCILLIIAFCAVTVQLVVLFRTYYSHPIQTTVSLDFSELQFPAISFCNMNPIRKSQLNLSPILKETIYPNYQKRKRKNEKTPTKVKRHADIYDTAFEAMNGQNTDMNIDIVEMVEQFNGTSSKPDNSTYTTFSKPDNRTYTTFSKPDTSTYTTFSKPDNSTYTTYSKPDTSTYTTFYYDEWSFYYDDYDEQNSTDLDESTEHAGRTSSYTQDIHDTASRSEHFQDPKDKWEELAIKIQTYYRNESVHIRKMLGHQKEDFIQRALFIKRQQNVSKSFTEFTTPEYGNCYTMDSPKYRSLQSGTEHGIQLTLYLEVDEYIENHSSGYGVRIVFHEPGTFPLPADEGLTLNPGYETNIGLRAINITRLGEPYGECSHSEALALNERYNVTYSKSACLEFCRMRHVIAMCGCMPYNTPDILNTFAANVPVCRLWDSWEEFCVFYVDSNLHEDKSLCDCKNPCSEFKYQMTISGRSWPNQAYLEKVLMRDLCTKELRSSEKACFQIKNESETFNYERYKNNFARVLIYFEDLNYETITEKPSYTPVRFISDIGGAVGLFMGTSLLSLFEILQLLLEIILYWRHRMNKQPVTNVPTDV